VFASGDPVRVRQILRNLVVNAHRYGGSERRMALTDSNGTVTFEIRDSGGPLPETIAQRIFEPYQRAHHGEGSPASIGLGLAVSRQLAAMMGGDVRYHHDGESVFSLVLPKWEAVDPHADESEPSVVSRRSE
jgi:signal transduction histidine kinase